MSRKPVRVHNKSGPQRSATRLAAEAAGMSRHQMYQAIRISSIDEAEFEHLVESENPPTITSLAEIGISREIRSPARRLSFCPHCGGSLAKSSTLKFEGSPA